MASKQSKTSLLSDKLEFEDVSKPSSAGDNDLPEEVMAAIEAAEKNNNVSDGGDSQKKTATASNASRKGSAPAATPRKAAPSKKQQSKKDKDEFNDKFARYAAIVALLSLIVILSATFIYKRVIKESEAPGYVVLPKGVANIDGQIIRMQITIQVKDADKEWLIENKRILSDLFQIELAKLDLGELKTEQDLEGARERMRVNLNKAMATDKIEAVLISEFLSQNKE